MRLEVLREYGLDQVGAAGDLDGPFLMADGRLGLLVSLRGRGGGAMPSPSELHWVRALPPLAKTAPICVFLRRGGKVTYLGSAQTAGRGQVAKDGYNVLLEFAEPLDAPTWRSLLDEANAPLAPAPEEAIAALTPSSSSLERIAALRVFASRWFGCREDSPEMELAHVPLPLRVLHGLVQGHDVCIQNKLVAPDQLTVGKAGQADESPHAEALVGKIGFYVENQGVSTWAIDAGREDPPVYKRTSEWDSPWVRESDSLSAFLIQVLVLEAVCGAPFNARHDGLGARGLAKLVKHVLPLPLPEWASDKTRFYGSAGVIGFSWPDGPDFHVWIGAKDRRRLEPLEKTVADWPDVGF
jgi:hypothetical protein